jgi:hypothetical protein
MHRTEVREAVRMTVFSDSSQPLGIGGTRAQARLDGCAPSARRQAFDLMLT